MIDINKIKYRSHRRGAFLRGIEWHFTYQSWLAWWGDDIVNRGRGKGQLVMARNGDIGPYHPDNVRKATVEENHREAMLGKAKSAEWKENISKAKKGSIPWNKGLTFKETV